ncbi:hypothetical protein [Bacillus sp. AP50]|uniref:hypothetical protein n=1 Tax=Bacillus sp. AP50 TaxID=3122950 RepID=UPI0033989AEB
MKQKRVKTRSWNNRELRRKAPARVLDTRLEELLRALLYGWNCPKCTRDTETVQSLYSVQPAALCAIGVADAYGVRFLPEVATALVRLGYNPSVLLHELWQMQITFPDGTTSGICINDNKKMFVPYFGIEQLAVELRDGMYSRMQKTYKKPGWFS